VTSYLRAEVEMWPFRACIMHPAIGTVSSLWTWLWGRYHVPQNLFLVLNASLGKHLQICHILFHFGNCTPFMLIVLCVLSTGHVCVCYLDVSSPHYVRSSYHGRRLDADDENDDDDTKSNTTDEETDLVLSHLQALTKARFVETVLHILLEALV